MASWFDEQGLKESAPGTVSPNPAAATVQSAKNWFDEQGLKTAQEPETPKEGPGVADYFRHFVGKFVPGAMSAGGALAGGAATEGLGGEIVGAGAGSLLGQNLQEKFPRLFGSAPKDLESTVGQTAADVAGNALIPAVGGKVASAFTKEGKVNLLASPLLQKTRQVQGALAQDTIDQGMKSADIMLSDATSQSSAIHGVGTDFSKKALTDVPSIQKYKATNGSAAAESLATSDVLKSGYSPTAATIDPNKILKSFDGDKSDVYSEAISPGTKQNVVDLMNTIKDAQGKVKPQTGNVINYIGHRLTFDAAMMGGGALLGSASGHELAGLGISGGIILTDKAITKAMSDPVIAKAVVAAIKTPTTATHAPLLGKIIMNGLRGSYVMYNGPEDKLEKAYVGEDGQLQYSKPSQN